MYWQITELPQCVACSEGKERVLGYLVGIFDKEPYILHEGQRRPLWIDHDAGLDPVRIENIKIKLNERQEVRI